MDWEALFLYHPPWCDDGSVYGPSAMSAYRRLYQNYLLRGFWDHRYDYIPRHASKAKKR